MRTIPTLFAVMTGLGMLLACSSTSESPPADPDGADAGASGRSGSGGEESQGARSGAHSAGGSSSTGGAAAAGGTSSAGGPAAAGGRSSTGGVTSGTGGAPTPGTGGAVSADRCASTSLTWKTARKTNYESYPDPGSPECIEYNGCEWAGLFAGCNDQQSKAWVASHDIAALFPNFDDYALHDLCIRSGDRTMIVTVYDTCGDLDCGGCCTENQGSADALIDLESYTDARWGLPDGAIEWADLGPSAEPGCE